jgi:23S rRNA (guanine745-N1)-methyltransferase
VEVKELLIQRWGMMKSRQVHYCKKLHVADLKHLVQMTPLSWGTTEENIENALQSGISSVTIDITVVVSRKKTFLK